MKPGDPMGYKDRRDVISLHKEHGDGCCGASTSVN